MIKFYERLSKMLEEENYVYVEKNECESQFLNSKPEQLPIVGIIPMTGEGVDATINDLGFCSELIMDEEVKVKKKEFSKKFS